MLHASFQSSNMCVKSFYDSLPTYPSDDLKNPKSVLEE